MAILPTTRLTPFGQKPIRKIGRIAASKVYPPRKKPVVRTGPPSGRPGTLYGGFAGMPGASVLSSVYSPLLKQLAAQEKLAQDRARGIYAAHSDALASALGTASAPLADIYGRGAASTAGVAEAVANRLQGTGQAEGQSLAAKLAQINSPQTGGADVQQMYQGLSSAGFAANSADLQRMIDEGTAAQGYAAKLPGIGRLAASQQMGSYLSDVAQEFGGQRKALMEQIPQVSLSLLQQAQQQRMAMLDQRSKERMALMALGNKAQLKAMERKWEIQDRNFNANLKLQLEQMGIDARMADDSGGYNLTGYGTNSKFVIDPRTGAVLGPNPNYVAPKKPAASSGKPSATSNRVDLRVRRNQAVQEITAQLFNPKTRAPRESAPRTIPELNGVINRILRMYEIDPFKKQGTSIRRSILFRMGLRQKADGSWFQP